MFYSCLVFLTALGQHKPFKFAHVTDTHIGGSTGKEDLELTVKDINENPEIEFVILSGDVTEFGSDEELMLAKSILDKLNKPVYVLPGNHDSKWSESGCNTFVKVFGSEAFSFEKNGYRFIGTASGPNMRMGPGQVPREQVLYLDSILANLKDPAQQLIFVNHYTIDRELANWNQIIDRLKKHNIQADLMGHGHANKQFNFEGIPAVMGRSNLRAKKEIGGYNIVTIQNDTLYYNEKQPGRAELATWCKVPLFNHHFEKDTAKYFRPDYSINQKVPQVKVIWQQEMPSDIGAGVTVSGKLAVVANTQGAICALDRATGRQIWRYQTRGKIFSTPAVSGNNLVCGSSDQFIYNLDLKTGKLIWKFETGKSVLASPLIDGNVVFIGGSDNKFRAIDLLSGKLIWQFDSVKNFVETRALVYDGKVYFGSWGNEFYALDKKTGKLIWKRSKYSNRMLSPAAVFPVAASGKIFIVAPDRYMTALDAQTGNETWNSKEFSCREAIGISQDKKLVYIKNMTEGDFCAFYADSASQKLAWNCKADFGYEICPSPIVEDKNLIFVPTATGVIYAINKKTHVVEWKYKIANTLINNIFPAENNQLYATTMDGIVVCLQYSVKK
jgi:outer membrane protein assembly factor BamB/predicted phosphodiesterase